MRRSAMAILIIAVRAQPSTLVKLTSDLYHVTKNISDLGVILSMVFERAICKLNLMSSSPGESNNARS